MIVKLYKTLTLSLGLLFILPLFSDNNVNAESSHPNLFVSAENSLFENHFSGSMVVEVVIIDNDINTLDDAHGEPDVTVNGKKLRMVQATDGNWYGYFASKAQAVAADRTVGLAGKGLDFGEFCSKDSTGLGATFTQTVGVAIGGTGATGATDGTGNVNPEPFTSCTTGPSGGLVENVVRESKSLNTILGGNGQIGLADGVFPMVQLYDFTVGGNVIIMYNKGGGSQRVDLSYSDIPNISLNIDRSGYPKGAEVFVTINDMQLNQDPTDIDSWTFNINSTRTAFYQAFTETGANSGNGGLGLVNLNPYLASLGFEKNGNLGMNLGSVAILRTNQYQPSSFVTSGVTSYNKIVTLVESEPNSGIFHSFDYNDQSVIGISSSAPRGQSGTIEYNSKTASVVTGDSTASLSLGISGAQFNPGQKATITLVDNDQNFNPGADEDLDVFRSTAIIPTLKIGKPVTLQSALDVKFYAASTTSLSSGTSIPSSVPDPNSDRMIVDTRSAPNGSFEKVSINLGITAKTLQDLFIDIPSAEGTNWINYDLRSFEQQLGITSFSDTNMTLHFDVLPGSTIVQILDAGDMSGGKGLVRIDDADIDAINAVSSSSQVYLVINFDQSADTANTGIISSEADTQPIVFDLFSFGDRNDQRVNNAIYRAELEETSANSGVFTGTMEYVVINQLNQNDPNLIGSLRPINNEIKFLVNDKLSNEDAINLAYSDVAKVGVTVGVSSKTEIRTQTGSVTLDSQNYRFGQPVVVVLTDPDLNTKHDVIDVYNVVDDPSSGADDTVGDPSGNILLEIRIKGFKYHRCTIDGIGHAGLGSTGFALVETGTDTGIFKGNFKMPSQICNEAGTKLISPAGGSIEVSYFDFRDASGQPSEIGLTFQKFTQSQNQFKIEADSKPKISIEKVQMRDSFDRPILQKPIVGQKINFVTEISNNDQKSQSYSYIIQIKDENNRIVDLRWIDGTIIPTKKKTAEILWEPKNSGKYTVEIFVWDGIESALPLTTKTEYHLNVGSR